MKFIGMLICIVCMGQFAAKAQKRPYFQVLRFNEDYAFLSDSLLPKTKLDKLKNIPVGDAGSLTIGGEINQAIEYVATPYASEKEDAYWLSRLMLHAGFTFKKTARLYGELASGVIKGRNGGARTIDRDDVYVLNLFAEFRKPDFTIRVGRQELTYGGENLISVRNGTNVRYTFDAARVIWKKNNWTIDGFAASYVNTNFGAFDNPVLDVKDNMIWGVHAAKKNSTAMSEFSMYYMGYKDPQAFYSQYRGREYRHSLGVRYTKTAGSFNYTVATVYQAGKADTLKASAFQLAFIASYGIKRTPVKISVTSYVSSGDKNPGNKTISSFNPYFPQQASFRGAMATRIFPMNVIFIGPKIDMNIHPFSLTADGGFLWRYSKAELINLPGGFPAYRPDVNSSNYLGYQAGFSVVQSVNHYLSLLWVYSHFTPTKYFNTQPNAGQVNDFFVGKLIFKF